VLRYLARYAHRVAIGDHRLVAVDDETVSCAWKDHRADNEQKVMRLSGREWLRRFSEHVLRRGFTRLRSYGFLVNTRKSERLTVIRELLGAAAPQSEKPTTEDAEMAPCRCPVCGVGLLTQRRSMTAPAGSRRTRSTPTRMGRSGRKKAHRADSVRKRFRSTPFFANRAAPGLVWGRVCSAGRFGKNPQRLLPEQLQDVRVQQSFPISTGPEIEQLLK
jgi:hypothetical protein